MTKHTQSDKQLRGMRDGLAAGKTIREVCLIYGYRITDAPSIRENLYSRFGEKQIREIIEGHRLSPVNAISKALGKAATIMADPLHPFATEAEEAERLLKCNACPKQDEEGRCTYCNCPCVRLVTFRKIDCEEGRW